MTIDTSKIEGYDAMTPEQKLDALTKFEIPEPDYSGYVKKDQFDKTASELAKIKKEKSAAENDTKTKETELDSLKKMVEELQKDKQIATYTAQFIGSGYGEEDANARAQAIIDGDIAKAIEIEKKFLGEYEKKIKADLMKGSPKLGGGEPPKKLTRDELNKMSVEERYSWIQDNPEFAKEILGGE